jgi:hypothetical protein
MNRAAASTATATLDNRCVETNGREIQISKTQDEPQWIVAQRLLSALTIPGFK